jgi:glycosyltransferase involved in cell wall biosynthesis
MEVSIIAPVYRNADTLVELHRRLVLAIEKVTPSFEVIFVDDACPQGSFAILESLCCQDDRVCVIALETNHGQNTAVLAGLRVAQGKRVVILDADLQDPPEAIPQLLAEMDKGFPIVFAGRRGPYEAPQRLLTSRVFKFLLRLISGLPKDAGIFVAIQSDVVQSLLQLYAPQPFIVAMIGCLGIPMTSLPVARASRLMGKSAYSPWKRLKTGILAVWWAILWKYGVIPRKKAGRMPKIAVKSRLGTRFREPLEE